ncbi:hypothetical protein [Sorangium sp. So ce1335]|uniref:hypothetical protein n=1 Tax=Sorangium sp. So ce1335 TaxID=3133335 RepID=UPI003F62A373
MPIKITTPYVCIVLEIAAQLGLSDGRSELGWDDLDGDGTVDHVLKLIDGMLRESDAALRARLNLTRKTNRLERVVRPLGGSFALDYACEGNKVAHASAPGELSVDTPGGKCTSSARTASRRATARAGCCGSARRSTTRRPVRWSRSRTP